MKRKRSKGIITQGTLLLVGMAFLTSFAWADTGPATDSLKGTLDKIINVLNDPSLKTPGKENERNEILFTLIKERFDEEAFARRALGVHWTKRTEEEKKEFVEVFSDLLGRTYLDKIDSHLTKDKNFSKKNILYLDESARGDYVVITTQILTADDAKIPVHYLFKNNHGKWLVCDVAIEGVSIAKNYRAQFKEILASSSFADLISKLKSKQQK
ncbi:MAG: MlaC/ttg2D family ABC transporter substrate-binding protein [Thermodesulfobacteriota bacterium]